MTTPMYEVYATLKEAQAKYDELKETVTMLNLVHRRDGKYYVSSGEAVLVKGDELITKNY